MNKVEILAPVGSMEALEAAVRCGADAVYLGQKNFSARKNSQNFDEEELREAVAYAHRCGVQVHQALNILVFDHELDALKRCIKAACRAGVDALIVQDLGVASIVKTLAPQMLLHASTQMAVYSPAGVKAAEDPSGTGGIRPRSTLYVCFGTVLHERFVRREKRQPRAVRPTLSPSIYRRGTREERPLPQGYELSRQTAAFAGDGR